MAFTVSTAGLLLLLFSLQLNPSEASLPNETIISDIAWGEMSIYLKHPHNVYHMEEDLMYPGNIIFSDYRTIRTTDGSNNTVIVGTSTYSGYVEGVGTAARLNMVSGFYQINSSHLIFADKNNHCLRMLNRLNGKTEPFAGKCGTSGFQDGFDSRFTYPWSIIKDETSAGKVIVADYSNHAMRRVDLVTKRVTTLLRTSGTYPRTGIFDKKGDLLVVQNHMLSEFRLSDLLNTNIVGSKSIGTTDGPFEKARFYNPYDIVNVRENVYLVADVSSDRIRIVDLEQSWVRSICGGGGTSSTVNGDLIKCRLDSPHSLLLVGETLYIGTSYGIRKMKMRKFNPYSKCPPAQISAQVAVGENEVAVEVVPGLVAYLSPGYHKFNLPGTSCVTYVSVTASGVADPASCPKAITVVAESGKKYGIYSYKAGGVTHKISLSLGSHTYQLTSASKNCSLLINVIGISLKRRLDFSAEYDIKCSDFDGETTYGILQALAVNRYSQIEEVCDGRCKRSSNVPVFISCKSDVVTIKWPTNVTYNADVKSIPSDLMDFLKSALAERAKILDMVIYTRVPPIVYPTLNSEGLPASIMLSSYCGDNLSYNSATDSCV